MFYHSIERDCDTDCADSDCEGQPRDDGLFCTGVDTCSMGTCVGAGDPCPGPDGDTDCCESCDEATDSCTANDPDGSPCNGGTCSAGTCVS